MDPSQQPDSRYVMFIGVCVVDLDLSRCLSSQGLEIVGVLDMYCCYNLYVCGASFILF